MPGPLKMRTWFWLGNPRTCGKWSPKSSSPPATWWPTLRMPARRPSISPTPILLDGLLNTLRPGDVVLVMSNGDFNHLVPRLCAALEEPSLKT